MDKRQRKKKCILTAAIVTLSIGDICAAYLITTKLLLKKNEDYLSHVVTIDNEDRGYEVNFNEIINTENPAVCELTVNSLLLERVKYTISFVSDTVDAQYASYMYVTISDGENTFVNNTLDQLLEVSSVATRNLHYLEKDVITITCSLLPEFTGSYQYDFAIMIKSRGWLI